MTGQPTPSEKSQETLKILREAVRQELEKKRRLGHYYVDWKNGKAVLIGEDAPMDDDNVGKA